MTFISIIIPFKKGKRYLKDCLDSLGFQNLEDEEIIIIINGSHEENVDILIEGYANLNIIVKYFNEEIGVAKARNEGLKIANGKYIYFIDGDDYIYEKGLLKLIQTAKNTDADFINGERINTYFIRDRFKEQLVKTPFTNQNKLDTMLFSLKLLVGCQTNDLEVLSVLHALIKKDKLKNVCFNEKNKYFSDYEFIMDIFSNIDSFYGVENAIYAKRQSDDPIKLPSLNQEDKGDSISLYFEEYNKLKIHYDDNKFKLLKQEMLNKFYRFFLGDFSINFARNPDDNWRTLYFEALHDILKEFDLKNLNFIQKREFNVFLKKDFKNLKKITQYHFMVYKFKQMLNEHWLWKHLIYTNLFNKQKLIDNQIFIESFRGDFYSDNPKYLYEYLYENYGDEYQYVWVLNHKNKEIPGNPKTVKKFSFKYYWNAAKSKYWLTNTRQSAMLKKRHDQILISTWHGTPLKKLGFDMGNIYLDDPKSKFNYKKDSSQWDYLISPNQFTSEKLRSSFAYEGEVLQMGYPRNDILYNYDENLINKIKSNLNLPDDKKVILYAPTWRDDESYDVDKVKFSFQLDLNKLKESISDEYIILIRTHYFITNKINLNDFKDFAFDVSKYEDIAELYLISDILITDYSSVFFDYANLKRPILFYTYDIEKYSNILRGFYMNIYEDVPGPLLYTTDEVINAIENIDYIKNEYSEKYIEFYEKFCSIDDGMASKRIVDKIWKK